jgi:uncharacterized protein YkwD
MVEKPLYKQNSDNYKGLLRPNTLGLLLLAFLAVKVFIALMVPQNGVSQASDLTTDNILSAVNQQRSLRNLVTLNTNSKLTWAAQSKTDDMQARHYFAHVDPDGHYIWDKIVAAGYTPYLELGENLAIEFFDTDSLISAWMNSPTHRANLLNDGFRDQGMGLTFGDAAKGQYHSAIANTFGTLVPTPKPKILAAPAKTQTTAPKPVAPAPKPQTLGAQQTPATTTAQSQTPSPATATTIPLTQPVFPRAGQELAQNNPQSNFIVSSQPAASSTSSTSLLTALPVIGNLKSSALAGYQQNRYLVLFAGVILLLLMLSDIKKHVQNKLGHLDKKFNNLIVLIISLVVVAFLYWL